MVVNRLVSVVIQRNVSISNNIISRMMMIQCTCRHLYSMSARIENKKLPSFIEERDMRTVHNDYSTSMPLTITMKCFKRNLSEKSEKNLDFRKENIFTIPNLLSMFRITVSPYLGYLVLSHEYMWAFSILVIAAFTDMLDGHIARRYPSQSSRIGSILDPLADKCLISVLTITLTLVNLIPLPLTLLIISRDLGLIIGSFYIRYVTVPRPITWSKFWDIQRSAVQVTPSFVSKLNTTLQLLLVGMTTGAPVFHYIDHPLLQSLWYATAITTLSSGLSYIFQMKGFKVVQNK